MNYAKTFTLSVSTPADVICRALAVLEGDQHVTRISFASTELLWKVLTEKRWTLLRAMAGQEPMSIREAARRVDRDVKAVHADVRALLNAGLIDRTEASQIVFPYDAIHVDFVVKAA